MLVLVTGATGKVGQVLLESLLSEPRWAHARIRALCHNRSMPPQDRLEIIRGSIADRAVVEMAMAGVTHVIHMATVKEDPLTAMDVSVKGMFWLLEAFRVSPTGQQFMLIGGDCVVGHIIMPYDAPITENSPGSLIRECMHFRSCSKRSCWSNITSSMASTVAACARHGSWKKTTSGMS